MKRLASTPTERLMLVTGSTRSGTSLAAGTLHHLGFHVPQPVLAANASNPSGFFESTWPLWFHRRLMDRCLVSQTDARPEAFHLMAGAVSPDDSRELASWLELQLTRTPRVVIKDPRALWVPELWRATATRLGIRLGLVAMVRHPAEVVASRTTYYGTRRRERDTWAYQVRNLCTWINVNTGLELRTRGMPRSFVRYEDLLDDWRPVMARVGERVGVDLDPDPDDPAPRAIDEFVDPTLRRHLPTWDGMELPEHLVATADGVWEALGRIADGDDGPEVQERLDELREAYATEMRLAVAMAHDVTAAQVEADRASVSATRVLWRQLGRGLDLRRSPRARRLVDRWMPLRLRRLVARRGS
jgi:hypothetical protein